jgi:hypothetical protein
VVTDNGDGGGIWGYWDYRKGMKKTVNMENRMKKIAICLFLFSLIVSCKNKETEFTYIDLSQISILNSSDVLYSFDDKYPVGVSIRDSFAYIIQIKSDTGILVLDMNAKQIIHRLGNIGHGPDDIIRVDFMPSIENNDVLLEDGSVKKFLKIDFDSGKKIFTLKKYMDYPDIISPSGETNISKNFIAGRKVGKGKMFYIYNRNTNSMIEVDYYPVIKNLIHDPNYIYAPTIALNEEKNRIMAGMYLFDMFHLYDLEGKRIQAFCFSENCIPRFDSNDMMQDIQKCNAGLIRSFPTNDYCYFLRITGNRLTDETENMLLRVDWDGKLINAYKIQDNIEGQFYINEKEKKMYIVRNAVKSLQNDIYEIVSYKLN